MRALAFNVQKGGINRQRIRGGAKASNLYDAVNCYVTGSGTVVQRDGTIRDATLPSTTRGLAAFGDLLHTFSYQLEADIPVGYLANVLAHPTDEDATLDEIHFAQPFMGALYVVAEWSDGGVYHYWLASSGEWEADTVYKEGDVVTPTTPNGLLYKATANNPDAPTQTWQPLNNYSVGDKVLPTTYTGFYYEVTATQGDVPISGASEPVWGETEGAETVESVDGTGAPATSASDASAPQVPPPIQDRYGTGQTTLSDAAAAAVGLSDSVANWQPGTLYQPGALVKPLSAAPVINSAIPNAGFESGDTGWDKDTGWHITNSGSGGDGDKPYQGSWFAYWNENEGQDLGWQYLTMATAVPVVPGQFLSASCYDSRMGGNNSGMDGQLVLLWYDAYDVLVKETEGTFSGTTHAKNYRVFTVQDSTPGGATKVKVAYKARGTNDGGQCAIDSFAWDYVNLTPAEADFTIYQAVQSDAATSGTSEPTWPGAGNTVVDGGVTWLGGVTSVITWTARPIMKSGSTEPVSWNTDPSYSHPGATDDNTITWQTTTGYVAEAPNSKYVVLAAKKVFAGDDDIVAYSATVNPLDWTTAEDAGYLPTGLNTYGANPVKALGLYRGNLMPFNSGGFQMWQVDPDPELMQLLDAAPIGSTYHKALQAVKNDLVFLTQLGYRSIGIAGASTNLKAGDLGDPIDVLVQAQLAAGTYEPNSIYYPARGQYWGWFGPQVFVCTFNDEGRSWTRYIFPEALTDATIFGDDLYLRTATDKVWKVDADTLVDDYANTPGDPANLLLHFDEEYAYNTSTQPMLDSSLDENVLAMQGFGNGTAPVSQAVTAEFDAAARGYGAAYFQCAAPSFDLDAEDQWSVEAWIYTSGGGGYATGLMFSNDGNTFFGLDTSDKPTLILGGSPLLVSPDAVTYDQWVHLCVCKDGAYTYLFVDGQMVDSDNSDPSTSWGNTNLKFLLAGYSESPYFYADELRVVAGQALFTANFTPPTQAYDPNGELGGTEFEGTLWWPALGDGANMQLDSFDLVCQGEVTVQFGYDQRDPTVLTTGYLLDGDTLPGTSIPFPMSAPSFAPKLVFSGNQAWEWMAFNLYIQDSRSAGFAG